MAKNLTESEVLLSNVRSLVKMRQGREVIWAILEMCDIYSPLPGEFTAGKRAVGIDILSLLEDADPTIYPNLLLKAQEKENA